MASSSMTNGTAATSDKSQPQAQAALTTTSSLLLCEALGFSPQLLLDDIINISTNAGQDGIRGIEEYMAKWMDEREARNAAKPKEPEPPTKGKKGKKKAAEQDKQPEEDLMQEVEQGIVAFQTLLEYHSDIAFDFFEAWSLRNIFFIPPELENGGVLVLPHYEGADLTMTATGGSSNMEEKERELIEEMEELRKRLDEQRRLTRMLHLSLSKARASKRKADKRLNKLVSALPLSSGDGSTTSPLDHLVTLPQQLMTLYEQTSTLPPLEPWSLQPQAASGSQDSSSRSGGLALTGTGKREWEVGSSGYANWAVNRLVSGPKPAPSSDGKKDETAMADAALGTTWVDQMERVTEYVGNARDVKGALEAFQVPVAKRKDDEMDVE